MLFSKDVFEADGYSKFNALSFTCMKYMHECRFSDGPTDDIVVCHAGDGRIMNTKDAKRQIYVVHDWNDAYLPYLESAVRIIYLGNFDHPVIRRQTVTLNSYPIDPSVTRLPLCDADITVVGDVARTDQWVDWDSIDKAKSIRVAVADPLDLHMFADFLKDMGFNIDVPVNRSLLSLTTEIRSARNLIHLGHGRRGMIPSLAIYLGVPITVQTGDIGYEPALINDFLNAIDIR